MLKKALALASIILPLSSHAAIVDLGNITRDTDTGLLWLDVTESRGFSYDQVTSMMGAGQAYEGWRYATAAEFDQLVVNFGYSAVTQNCTYGVLHCDTRLAPEKHVVKVMIATLGDTLNAKLDEENSIHDISPNGAGFVIGILGSQNKDPNEYDFATISDYQLVYRSTGENYYNQGDTVQAVSQSVPSTNFGPSTGSFLVKVSEVPVPATAWLFGSALIGLAGLKRKK